MQANDRGRGSLKRKEEIGNGKGFAQGTKSVWCWPGDYQTFDLKASQPQRPEPEQLKKQGALLSANPWRESFALERTKLPNPCPLLSG